MAAVLGPRLETLATYKGLVPIAVEVNGLVVVRAEQRPLRKLVAETSNTQFL